MEDIEGAKKYLVEKGLPEIVNDMTAAIVTSKPADPLRFIADWAGSKGQSATGGARPILYILPVASFNNVQVVGFITDAKLDIEIKGLDVMKGEHRTPEMLAINPGGLLPFLVDGDLKMGESMAIMRYLCDRFGLGAPWYGASAAERGLINRAMDWRQTEFYKRLQGITYPVLGFNNNYADVAKHKKDFIKLAEDFGTYLHKDGFLIGGEPCVADYAIAVGLEWVECDPDYTLPPIFQAYRERFAKKSAGFATYMAQPKGFLAGVRAKYTKEETTLYYMAPSANSIQVLAFVMDAGIECEKKMVAGGESRTPDFLKINPLGQLPTVADSRTSFGESMSVMRYFCNRNALGDPWYPTDPVKRAKCEMVMDWRQTSFYPAIMNLTYHTLGFTPNPPADIPAAQAKATEMCEFFTANFCEKDGFVLGDKPCIADYAIFVPLEFTPVVTSWTCPPDMAAAWERFKKASPNLDKAAETMRGYVGSKKA